MADFGFAPDTTDTTSTVAPAATPNLGFIPDVAHQIGFTPDTTAPRVQPAQAPAEPNQGPKGGWVWSAVTTDQDLQAIADKHGVPVQDIKDIAGYFGATKQDESLSDLVKQAAGSAGEAVGFGLPQKLYKRLQDPKLEGALDDLSELAEHKKSTLRTAAEIFGGVGTAGLTSALGPLALPVMGAAAGYAHARAGEELPATALGAVAAPVIGKAVETVAPYLSRAASSLADKLGFTADADAAKAVAPAVAETNGARLTKGGAGIEDIVDQRLQGQAGATLDAQKSALKSGYVDSPVDFLGGEEAVEKMLDPSSSGFKLVVQDLRDAGERPTEENIIQKLSDNQLESLRDDISKRVGATHWEAAVKEKGGIDNLVDNVYDTVAKERIARDAIKEDNLGKNLRGIGTIEGMFLKLSDDKPLMKIVDKRLGGGTKFSAEQAVDDLSANMAKAAPAIRGGYQELSQFDRSLQNAGISREQFNDLYRSSQLSPELRTQWDNLTKGFLDKANQAGAGIEGRADYIRDQLLPPVELKAALQTRVSQLSQRYGTDVADMTPSEFSKLGNEPDIQELRKAIKLTSGSDEDTLNSLTNGIKSISEDAVRNSGKLYSSLSVAKEKLGNIPQFIQDPDPIRAMQSWLTSTYKSLAVTEPLERLRSIANIADEAGDAWTAKHLRDKVQDILGVRKDTIAGGTKQIMNRWSSYWKAQGQDTLSEIPEYLRALNMQQYPGLLGGLNIKASLQNLSTPLLTAVPDVGLKEGIRSWWNSMGATRAYLMQHGKAGLEQLLEKEGIVPAHLGKEITELEAPRAGRAGAVKDAASTVNKKSNEALMFMFQFSELLGRSQAYFMGKDLGQKIAANPDWGKAFISKLNSPAYRRTMGQALDRGDAEGLQNQMIKYLNSNHLLNYDQANKSAFGRYIGSTFSAFQKWPTTALGKVLQEYYDKGAGRGTVEIAKKLMAPVAALGIVDQYYRGSEDNHSARSDKILGRSLADMAPGASIKDVVHYRGTPLQSTMAQFGDALFETKKGYDNRGIADKLSSAAQSAMSTYLPMAGWLKMFGEDLPTLIYNRKPTGAPIERRINTIERGGKPQ